MLSTTESRVQALRDWLTQQQLDAFILPHEDEFLGEYIPEHNERLHWLTGFTGSAGAAVITRDQAAVFVDGRYTVQVKKQVDGNLFEYRHLVDEPALDWLIERLQSGARIGIDTRMHSANWLINNKKRLPTGVSFQAVTDNPIDVLWHDRPSPTLSSARLMPLERVGQSSFDKRQTLGVQLTQAKQDAAYLSQLDSVCWLLNIRGGDVSRLPVLLSSAILYADGQVDFFIDAERLPADFATHVGDGVTVFAPDQLATQLSQLSQKNVLLDLNASNAWAHEFLEAQGANVTLGQDPCMLLKAAKNATEIAGMKACHIRDGVAISRFLAWLDREIAQGKLFDEAELAEKLLNFRQADASLVDLSFDTISAAGKNAAMCHYNHLNQPKPSLLERDNVYLVDSGGQYPDGTTDITRTIAIGECDSIVKKTFTLVLKGHIALASAKFPKGTTGSQLDALARQHLWAHGFDYDHGTGHGVGHFLSVHEGPQRISKVANTTALLPGMVLSNEPGYYRADGFGIRIENLETVVEVETAGDLPMLGFESLTRAPIDKRLIAVDLLSESERQWLNDYHQTVFSVISPALSGDDLTYGLSKLARRCDVNF